jgi:hypothetical protein
VINLIKILALRCLILREQDIFASSWRLPVVHTLIILIWISRSNWEKRKSLLAGSVPQEERLEPTKAKGSSLIMIIAPRTTLRAAIECRKLRKIPSDHSIIIISEVLPISTTQAVPTLFQTPSLQITQLKIL